MCLCMIVRNEAHVLRRCLLSALPLIDTWAIVDTGSTDGTQQLIRDVFHRLPGVLAERPWVDFSHNRNEALLLARGRADYTLIIDADEAFEIDPGMVSLPLFHADAYDAFVLSGVLRYPKITLVRSALPWRFVGAVHEHIVCAGERSRGHLPWLRTIRRQEGARSRDPLTARRDALLLESEVLREPENPRHMFYLAQSYMCAGEPGVAIDRYRRRAAMGGWADEVFVSLYQIARLQQRQGVPWPRVLAAYLAAFEALPSRVEPLFWIGLHYQQRKQHATAMTFLERAVATTPPAVSALFVEWEIYSYMLPLEFAVCCFYLGRHAEALAVYDRLLSQPGIAADRADHLRRNRAFSQPKAAVADNGTPEPEGASIDAANSTKVYI